MARRAKAIAFSGWNNERFYHKWWGFAKEKRREREKEKNKWEKGRKKRASKGKEPLLSCSKYIKWLTACYVPVDAFYDWVGPNIHKSNSAWEELSIDGEFTPGLPTLRTETFLPYSLDGTSWIERGTSENARERNKNNKSKEMETRRKEKERTI